MKIDRSLESVHPILMNYIKTIQKEVIDAHNFPIRLFETGRDHDRHEFLIQKGKTKDLISRHLYNLENDPPLYTTAVDYVFYDNHWSWNLRDSTVTAWYVLFGNLVLDLCPGMTWYGINRKNINYCHYELSSAIVESNLSKYPCVIY